jgi:hypothetical protein
VQLNPGAEYVLKEHDVMIIIASDAVDLELLL